MILASWSVLLHICLYLPQSEEEDDVLKAVTACSKLFCCLLEKRELFRGELPAEEAAMSGECPL